MDEEDEGSKFCEEDIDQILQRRTQTITIQSEGKGSTFAKVSDLGLAKLKSINASHMLHPSFLSNLIFSFLRDFAFKLCFLFFSFFRPVSSHLETEQTFL